MTLLYLLICSLFSVVAGFSVTFSENPSQCAPFTVNWKADSSGGQLGPPFVVLIVPVNGPQAASADAVGLGTSTLSPPIRREIPDSAFSASTKSGNFTIDQLPLKAGEHFVVVMDDGFGYATGGVSTIHTVASTSGSSSCLTGTSASLSLSTLSPAQCRDLNIVTPPPLEIRGFVPGGAAFSLDLGTGSSGDVTTAWTVNRPSGTQFVLLYRGRDGSMASSGLLGTASGTDTSCLSGSHSLTATASFVTSSVPTSSTMSAGQSQSQSQSGGSKIKVPAIVGGIIGGLAFVGLIALATFFCVMRRTDVVGRPKSRSTLSPYVSGASRDPTTTSGAGSNNYDGGGLGRNDTGKSRRKTDLEGGLMGAIFGGSVKRKSDGYRGGREREMISSKKRREMYPGLSIASTQNRSIGLTTLDDDPPLPRRTSLDDMPPFNGTTAYRDMKRSEARAPPPPASTKRTSGETSSVITTPSTAPLVTRDRLAGVEEMSGYGSGSRSTGSRDRRRSMEDSPFQESATANTPSAWNSKSPTTRSKNSERPSTAPTTQQYSPSGFHRPTRRAAGSQESLEGYGGAHGYPPDRKVDEQRRASVTDDEIPRVQVDLLSMDTQGDVYDRNGTGRNRTDDERRRRDEKQRQEEASVRRVLAQSAHPYALAQSPHPDDEENERNRAPFTSPSSWRQPRQNSSYSHSADGHSVEMINTGTTQTQTRSRGWSSVSHPYSNPSLSHSDDGHRYTGGSSAAHGSSTQIIRHRDAGPMMGSEDGDGEDGGRRILELPPSYGEITSSNRRRDR
ncbi:SubName: Full=Uncharacterized protein {ECO:0000313/EMBL:CCA73212.1} [Serendipita indica DSM 11827]|nr:SubName: Full=Uncharacterized protein {ECO:0000313/EMBL:CCA73212.1} [Serendipita indica DSM 11827]